MSDERTQLWYLIGALVVGGAEKQLVDLVNELDRDRYDVTVWTLFDTNPLGSDLPPDVAVRSLSSGGKVVNDSVEGVTNPLVAVVAPLRFCLAARRHDPDIIQSFLFLDNIVVRVAGLVCSATAVTGVVSVPTDQSLLRILLDRGTISLSDVIVSNSRTGAEFARSRGASDEKLEVIYNGRNVDAFYSADGTGLREELGITANETVVGTVGRLTEIKGHHDLLEAWNELQSERPDTTLLLVGDGPERDALEAHAADLECGESVRFLGTRDNIPELLDLMDVFVFPSHYEGLPGAVIEAMSAGLPVVATGIDGNQELLDSYRSALFVPVKSPGELAWATLRLVEHDALADALGTAAHRRASEQFTVGRMATEFESVYERVAAH